MYICMYVRRYVCVHGWMDGWMDGWMFGCSAIASVRTGLSHRGNEKVLSLQLCAPCAFYGNCCEDLNMSISLYFLRV